MASSILRQSTLLRSRPILITTFMVLMVLTKKEQADWLHVKQRSHHHGHNHGHHHGHTAAAAALPAAGTGVEGQQAAGDSLNTEDYLGLLQIAQQDSFDTAVRQRPVRDDGSPAADVGEVLHPGLLQDLQQMATAADLERGTQPLKAAVGYLLED